MEKYIGKSVYKGTAIGPVNVLKKSESLIKLKSLLDAGILTQEEFDIEKKKILNS